MPKKVNQRAPKSGGSKAKKKPRAVKLMPDEAQPAADPRFVSDLLVRGEAAELTKDGKLPLQATHIIQKKNPDGSVEVKRARFKLF